MISLSFLGQVVILVQRLSETQGSYDVLGVRKVVQSTSDFPGHVPVLVTFAEPKASGISFCWSSGYLAKIISGPVWREYF